MKSTIPPSVEVWSHQVIRLLDEVRQARERIVREKTMEAALNFFDTEPRVLRELLELSKNAPGFNVIGALKSVMLPQLTSVSEILGAIIEKLEEENDASKR